jgi:putative ABC transport system ATP-binding protein
MHLLGCLDTPTSGIYRLQGQDANSLSPPQRAEVRNTHVGFIFQSFNLLPRLNALENVALPLHYRGQTRSNGNGQTVQDQARRALKWVGLDVRADHRPTELSGGEQQRVAIARALVADPRLILADEPTGNLDSQTGLEVMQLLLRLWQEGRTILMVTHDAGVAAHAQRILIMRDGRIVR